MVFILEVHAVAHTSKRFIKCSLTSRIYLPASLCLLIWLYLTLSLQSWKEGEGLAEYAPERQNFNFMKNKVL